MGKWQCCLVTIMAIVFKESNGSNEEWYLHPPECYPMTWDGPVPNNVYLTCNMFSVQNDTHFEYIVARRLLGFHINCSSSDVTSHLRFRALSHLYFLEELVFDGCQFAELPSDTLTNLTRLGALVIADTHLSPQNSSPGLRLPNDLLINNPNLTIIHLKNNAIESLPPKWLCSSPKMMLLSLPGNRFRSLKDIGCGPNSQCCSSVQGLNLSHNAINELWREQMEQLVEIQVLDFRNNHITFIEEGTFDNMFKLTILDLSDNLLTTIHTHLLRNNQYLEQLLIGGNYLTEISPELCCSKFNSLLLLDVGRNNITTLVSEMFNPQPRSLMLVDLSYTGIRVIPEDLFNTFTDVSQLNLDNCQLEQLPDGVFRNAHSLSYLTLMNNKLQSVSSSLLQGLGQLKNLNMSANSISSIHKEAFAHCPLIQFLDLSSNQIASLPYLPSSLTFLSLSYNQITEVDTSNLTSLVYADLSHNQVNSVNATMCTRNRTELKHLDLSYNQLHTISSKALNVCLALDTLLLHHNNFTHFDKRITYMLPELHLLDLSYNHIMFFDYNIVPDALQYLDISFNQIKALEDTQFGLARLQMTTLIAHHNHIENLSSPCLPYKIQVVHLQHNIIKVIIGSIFNDLRDLKIADLGYNMLRSLNQNAFMLYPPQKLDRTLPKVILLGNMPYCSCELAWLVYQYQSGQRDYVEIIKPYYCLVTHKRMGQFNSILKLQSPPSDILDPNFLCPYELNGVPTNSPACLESCTCYYDITKNFFEVDCGQKVWNTNITQGEVLRLPIQTKRLFLDGNVNLQSVANVILRNISQLKMLFMNGSGIEILMNNQFKHLCELEELHLENNFLSAIGGTEFDGLVQLKNIFLHANRLKTVNMKAFLNLPSLKLLTLHNNMLSALGMWHFVNSTFDVTLRKNPFECTCNFQHTIKLWARYIKDLSFVNCINNAANTEFSAYNETYCQEESVVSKDQTTVILAVVCALLLVVTSVTTLLYIYRLEMQVWVYSRYGIRFFHQNHTQDDGKLFDAFISYSSDDDKFVAHELVPRLERNMHFRLCIHQRDFPVGGFISETIVDAVENSCRTLLVLTHSFAASEWCRFEFKMAHHRSMQDRCCRLIVIILEDVDPNLMDKELQLYLQTNTYLRWEDKLFWEKLIFAMPNPSELKNAT